MSISAHLKLPLNLITKTTKNGSNSWSIETDKQTDRQAEKHWIAQQSMDNGRFQTKAICHVVS